jgi:hypothetical protein
MVVATQDANASLRDKLEAIARELETRAGNALYVAAWKVAAKIVRSHKPSSPE